MAPPESSIPIGQLADEATTRLSRLLATDTPALESAAMEWMKALSSGRLADYFLHPEAFPMLQLPLWLADTISTPPDAQFQADLAYSTVCGYYFVRIVDDVMDGRVPPAGVMPAAIVFHTEFERAFAAYFPAEHPFWAQFVAYSKAAADTASADAGLDTIDRDSFLRISSRKVVGAKIPLAATCHHYGHADQLSSWSEFVDVLGRWHQMRNDVLGWITDLDRGAATYFLSEAARRQRPTESLAGWLSREGLEWAGAELDGWMDEMISLARDLGSEALLDYLAARRATSDAGLARIQAQLQVLEDVVASSTTLSASQRSASASDQPLRRA